MIDLPTVVRVSPLDFIDTFDRSCIKDGTDEINMILTSDLREITFLLYRTQPSAKNCRKLVQNFIEHDYGDFDYNWLPICFRHINT